MDFPVEVAWEAGEKQTRRHSIGDWGGVAAFRVLGLKDGKEMKLAPKRTEMLGA